MQRAAAPLLWCVAAVQRRGEPAPCAARKEKTCSGGERGREAEIMQISVCAGRWGNAGDEGSGALQGYARVGAKGLIPSPGWAGTGAPPASLGACAEGPSAVPSSVGGEMHSGGLGAWVGAGGCSGTKGPPGESGTLGAAAAFRLLDPRFPIEDQEMWGCEPLWSPCAAGASTGTWGARVGGTALMQQGRCQHRAVAQASGGRMRSLLSRQSSWR